MFKITILFCSTLFIISCNNKAQVQNNPIETTSTITAEPENKPLALENTDLSKLSDYERDLMLIRIRKDINFKTSLESPLIESDKPDFTGLNYYPPDESYKVLADINFTHHEKAEFKTSKNGTEDYYSYAEVSFKIKGNKYKLTVYSNTPGMPRTMFIPFKDLTNGKETYNAGRFIETQIPTSKVLELDFNQAYNPYCHYNFNYSCPLVPDVNNLNIEIKAGEKILAGHEH
ncbi:MAG: DUF1684 domain-containing protein [Bacteroidia bacterium]|nr:DUF1684 domain-containing protein [Bacteroidia bacterium]